MILTSNNYPFLEVFWTILIFFAFIVWLWILFTVFTDIFRRHDTSGFVKVLWIIFIIIIPYFGFLHLPDCRAQGDDRTRDRRPKRARRQKWTST